VQFYYRIWKKRKKKKKKKKQSAHFIFRIERHNFRDVKK